MPVATILVVDDDPDFVEVMCIVLTSADYKVVSASNSAEAFERIKAEKPDLMFLDIMMSTITDGLELSEQLRQDPALRYLPVIIVSSIADTVRADMGPMNGTSQVRAWISKPVAPKQLLETVHRVLDET